MTNKELQEELKKYPYNLEITIGIYQYELNKYCIGIIKELLKSDDQTSKTLLLDCNLI